MKLRLLAVVVVVAAAIAGITALLLNIAERKREAKEHYLELVKLTEDTIEPAEWGKNFPRQYDGYRRTVDTQRTRHGGSEAFQKLDEDPRWRRIFKGYAFGLDYREERGHAYMLDDQTFTERQKAAKQPGTCLHCHSAVIPAYRKVGGGERALHGDARLPRWELARHVGVCEHQYEEVALDPLGQRDVDGLCV